MLIFLTHMLWPGSVSQIAGSVCICSACDNSPPLHKKKLVFMDNRKIILAETQYQKQIGQKKTWKLK